MIKIKTTPTLLIIALVLGCTPLQSTYKPDRTTHAGICYTKYIEGELITDDCQQAVRYGQ